MRGVVGICLLVWATTGCSLVQHSCPTALAMGYLAPDGAGGALLENDGEQTRVRWPDGYKVEPTRLLGDFDLKDAHGNTVASAGDAVYVGGGFTEPGEEVFVACDYVSTDPPGNVPPLSPESAAPR